MKKKVSEEEKQVAWKKLLEAMKEYLEIEPDYEYVVFELEKELFDGADE